MEIRDAGPADMPLLVDAYNELIESTTYTWTEELTTAAERAAIWEARRSRGFPTLVCVDGNEPLGVASFGDFRDFISKPGYRFTVEHSVNVLERAWRRGAGRALMEALFVRAAELGVHSMIGGIDASNVGSIAFHERLGFREVARMPETGWKHERWCGLVFLQRFIDAPGAPR